MGAFELSDAELCQGPVVGEVFGLSDRVSGFVGKHRWETYETKVVWDKCTRDVYKRSRRETRRVALCCSCYHDRVGACTEVMRFCFDPNRRTNMLLPERAWHPQSQDNPHSQ